MTPTWSIYWSLSKTVHWCIALQTNIDCVLGDTSLYEKKDFFRYKRLRLVCVSQWSFPGVGFRVRIGEVTATINNSKNHQKQVGSFGQSSSFGSSFFFLERNYLVWLKAMKVWVSHFTTKNIEVNEITKPQPKPSTPKIVQRRSESNQKVVQTKKPPTGIKLERISLKTEANSKSHWQSSCEIPEDQIRKWKKIRNNVRRFVQW